MPEGKVKLSIIIRVIKQILSSNSYFPITWRPNEPFCGGLLEKLPNNEIKLYRKEEASVTTYRLIEAINYRFDYDKAIVKFLKVSFRENHIDDIQINYFA